MTRKKPQAIFPDDSVLEQYADRLPNPATVIEYISELVPNAPLITGQRDQQLILTGFACGWLAQENEQAHRQALQEQA